MDDVEMLTNAQSFEAMFYFLEQYWKHTGSVEIANLLGSLSIQSDGKPADAAMWAEWIACCNLAKENKSV